MKKIISELVFAISLLLIFGIVGGVEHGQPLTNMLWCIPLLFLMGVSKCIA